MNALSQWFVDTSFLLELGPVTHYFPLTHGGTNAHHMWRFDPLTYFVMSTFGLNAGVLWLLALLGFGTAILGNSLTKRGPLARALWLLAGVGLSVSAVLIFGFDVVTLGGIAWLPLLLSCLIFGQNAPSLGRLGLFGLTSIMFALSANQLALPASIVGVGCLWLTNDVRWSRWIQGALIVLVVPVLFITFSVPSCESPSLPPFSHYVSGYGTIVGHYALLGADHAEKAIDRHFLRTSYLPIAAALLLLTLCVRMFAHESAQPRTNALFLGILAIIALVVLDSSLIPPDYSQIAPLASLARIVPGLIQVPLTPLMLMMALFFLTLFIGNLSAQDRKWRWLPAVFCCITASGFSFLNGPMTASESPFDVLREIGTMPPSAEQRELVSIANSPSLYLLRMYGLGVLDSRSSIPNIRYTHALNKQVALTANTPDVELSHLLDARLDTRARLAAAPQQGGEWIHVRLRSADTLSGISLPTAQFFSDFPRGIEVRIAEQCADEKTNGQWTGYTIVANYPRWEGPVKFDRMGRPFFGPQAEVKVSFGIPKLTQCIAVIQRGKDPNFDWSAADLEIGVPRSSLGTETEQRM